MNNKVNSEDNSGKDQSAENKSTLTEKLRNYIKNLFDFSEFDAKTILYIVLFVGLVIVSLALLYYMFFIDETFLYRLVVEWFVNPIIFLGVLGIFLFLLIMAIQGLLVPIPSEIVLFAAGMVWGWFWGGIMGIIGSTVAGVLCYYISRRGGRPLAEKLVGKSALDMADHLIEKYGTWAIFIARFLPFVAFDPISYASGIVDIEPKKYTIATILGSIPRAFFYGFLGAFLIDHAPGEPIHLADIPFEQIEQQAALFNQILFIVLGILVVLFAVYLIYSKLWEKKHGISEPADNSE